MTNDNRTPRKLRIGVDLDGVIYPFVNSLRTHAIEHHGRRAEDLPEPLEWDFASQWQMTSAELVDLMQCGVDNGSVLLDQDPYPGAVSSLARLRNAGHTIHVITDRAWLGSGDHVAEARTVAWLDRNNINFDTLHFTADKTSTGLELDVFIEDRPKNFLALTDAGIDTFLRSHPYNAYVPTAQGRRVRDMTTFAARVMALAA